MLSRRSGTGSRWSDSLSSATRQSITLQAYLSELNEDTEFFQGDVRTKAEEKGVAKGVDMFASADEIFEAIVQVRDDPR